MKKMIGILLAAAISVSILYPVSSGVATFNDVPEEAPYYEAITELAERAVIGYGDGTFRPEDLITRAEFVTLMLKLLDRPDLAMAKHDQIFTDVPIRNWAHRYITIAVEKGFVNGRGNGRFSPNDYVTYEEAVKMVVSYLLGDRAGAVRFPDGYLALAAELELAQIGAEKGQQLTRGQTAMLIYYALHVEREEVDKVRDRHKIPPPDLGIPKETMGDIDAVSADRYSVAKEFAASGSGEGVHAESEFIIEEAPLAAPAAPAGIDAVPPIGILPERGEDGDLPEPYPMQISAGMLTAGAWNDNAEWDFWNRLMANREWHTLQSRWQISTNRYIVSVTDGEVPVIGATVALSAQGTELWTAVTDNRGHAVMFAAAAEEQSSSFTLTVTTSEDTRTISDVVLSDEGPYEVEIGQGYLADSIDVMFMVDTTGSMGDELQYIKEELSDVVSRINSDVRISCNFYRDVEDEYIVRAFDFTTDIDEAVTQISKQRATGGGDYPEAVELALANAIDEHDWNPEARERLLFLVLDAPPHYDAERVAQINDCIRSAAAQGIRIIPIASSGVDKETEFLLRSMSIATNGTYVFLTDHSGIGNSHIEPTIGQYTVQYLNDLIVEIINGRL